MNKVIYFGFALAVSAFFSSAKAQVGRTYDEGSVAFEPKTLLA